MSRSPILTDKAFAGDATSSSSTRLSGTSGFGAPYTSDGMLVGEQSQTMTLAGTIWATLLLLLVVVLGGVYGWTTVSEVPVVNPAPGEPAVTATLNSPGLFIAAIIVALIVAIVTAFKPKWARVTGFVYAVLEGYVLGAFSHLFDVEFNGIVLQAVLGTACVFVVMLAVYSLRIIRVTSRLKKGIVAATLGICLMYLVTFVASLFGMDMSFVYGTSGGGLGIVFSLFIVTIASFNLLLDFDFIENATKANNPKYMEWYGAFGLTVTLVWIYIEMLRLIARLRN